MSKASIGEQSWADMTEGRTAEARTVWNDGSFDVTSTDADREKALLRELAVQLQNSFVRRRFSSTSQEPAARKKVARHRFGLPKGFVSRLSRYSRTVLLEDNVYCLPNAEKYIPQTSLETPAGRNHKYALLTIEQYKKRKVGSVYVRTDGRIFDYSLDHGDPEREMFDTGFTVHDLERTGRYAPRPNQRSRERRGKKKAG